MPTILNAATELPDDSDETIRLGPLQARPPIPWGDSAIGTPSSSQFPSGFAEFYDDGSLYLPRPNERPHSLRNGSDLAAGGTAANLLTSASFDGPLKAWESQMESVLKEFYDSLRKDALPLHGSTTLPLHDSSSQSTLVPSSLRRTPSMASKAPSEHPSFRSAGARGLGSNLSSNASRFGGSRKRSRPKLLQTSTASSRSSMDDHGSSCTLLSQVARGLSTLDIPRRPTR